MPSFLRPQTFERDCHFSSLESENALQFLVEVVFLELNWKGGGQVLKCAGTVESVKKFRSVEIFVMVMVFALGLCLCSVTYAP